MNEQRMRFTVRLWIVDAHSVPTRRESQRRRPHSRSAAARSPPAEKITQMTCHRQQHYLLQRLVRLPRQRRHRPQLQTTTVRYVWSGNKTASHSSRAATLVSALLVSTESSVWAPAARFVADIQMVMRVYIMTPLNTYGSYNAHSYFKSTVNCFCAFVCDFDTLYSRFSRVASTNKKPSCR